MYQMTASTVRNVSNEKRFVTTLRNAAPVASPITYVVKTERQNGTLMHSAYTGNPTEENNHAWEDLIARMLPNLKNLILRSENSIALIFNATAEELVLAGEPIQDSVRVASGGYMASLGVYHELHCLVVRFFPIRHR